MANWSRLVVTWENLAQVWNNTFSKMDAILNNIGHPSVHTVMEQQQTNKQVKV